MKENYKVSAFNKEFTFNKKVSLLSLLSEEDKKKYLCAKVNNRIRELSYELYLVFYNSYFHNFWSN